MTPQPPTPPIATMRLFPGAAGPDLARSASTAFVIGRLLEEGDREDLRWLSRAAGEEALHRWLAQRGRRQLSRRSRAFWSLLLEGTPAAARDDPLWPL